MTSLADLARVAAAAYREQMTKLPEDQDYEQFYAAFTPKLCAALVEVAKRAADLMGDEALDVELFDSLDALNAILEDSP